MTCLFYPVVCSLVLNVKHQLPNVLPAICAAYLMLGLFALKSDMIMWIVVIPRGW